MMARDRLLPAVLLVVLGACAGLDREAGAQLEVSPAEQRDRRIAVVAGQPIEFRVVTGGPVERAEIAMHRAGRVVWQLPLARDAKAWTARARLADPGAHVLTVRLYQAGTVSTGALDVRALEPDDPRPPVGPAIVPLELVRTAGRPGGDANGWWGILAMIVLVVGVFAGSLGWVRRRKAA